jgi:putative ABC transport system permease protein
MIDVVLQDLRHAIRAIRSSPGFATVAILSLALGIGANTAIFSLINAVILKTLPVRNPEQLLQVTIRKNPFFPNPVWEQLRDRQDVFAGLLAYSGARFNLEASGEARYAQGNFASGQFFDTLGLRTAIGRTFSVADDRRGCPGIAVLGYGFWMNEYGGRADVLGKNISLDRHPFEIIGVLENGFTGVDVGRSSDIYVPVCAEKVIRGDSSLLDQRGFNWLRVIGRPAPGVSASQAESRLKTLAPGVFEATAPVDSSPDRRAAHLKSTFDTQSAVNGLSVVRREYRQALMVLMAMVGLVLLIACANVANLLLARGAVRQKEIAIRMALGSGRWRLMRQLIAESMVLSLAGAVLGMLLAQWGARLLVGLLSSAQNKVFLDLTLDSRVLTFTASVAILSGLLFGLVPAWRGTRVDPQSAMKVNSRGTTGSSKFGLGKALVVFQVALSLVLIVAAGLMLSTFFRLETLDAGFNRQNILLVNLDLRNANSPPARRAAVFEEMLEHLRALPGVRSVSSSGTTPINGSVEVQGLEIEGYTPQAKADTMAHFNAVSDRFFETLGTSLLAGRDFNALDTPQSAKVAIVNQTAASKFFAGQNPIGKRYRTRQGGAPVEIIGVVKDAKYETLREDIFPTVYAALSQTATPSPFLTYELRIEGGAPTALISAVKSSLAEVDRNVSLQFTTLAIQVEESLARERLLATLSGFFGTLALILAIIGLYGVVGFNVTRRRNEIGIRMALGADRARVLRMVLTEVAILVGLGLTIGVAVATGATRLVAGFLYGVNPNDLATFSLSAALLALVAILAGLMPARRASRVDPMIALREE